MKNAYTIEDLMQLMNIKSRSTFWRKRKQGIIPAPDIATGHPRWFRKTLDAALPNLNTNP